MRVVVALGGNALSPRGERLTVASQRAAVRRAAGPLADAAREHELVVTHGNGPQVGLLALQAAALDGENDFGLDVLDAESAGLIGYLIEEELANRLPQGRPCLTLLTRTVVDAGDPAFAAPTKFVGPQYDDGVADRLAAEHGWRFARDGGRARRVVASPEPRAIVPAEAVRLLLGHHYVVICGGGGGVPVVPGPDGRLTGVEAVVDKDAVSALVAREVDADLLVIATDVDAVYTDFGGPGQRALDVVDVAHMPAAAFPAGSMGPKVAAAAAFAASGGTACIGALDQLPGLIRGECGTRVIDSSRATVSHV